jgi:hypothetical protein
MGRRFSFELDSGEFFAPRVSSPYAALIDTVESSGGSSNTLKIFDLRTGHLADHDVGNGKAMTLDSGQLGSLALSGDGRLVYWLKDGVAHRARLDTERRRRTRRRRLG